MAKLDLFGNEIAETVKIDRTGLPPRTFLSSGTDISIDGEHLVIIGCRHQTITRCDDVLRMERNDFFIAPAKSPRAREAIRRAIGYGHREVLAEIIDLTDLVQE